MKVRYKRGKLLDDETKCYKCGVLLTRENSVPSMLRNRDYICKSCFVLRHADVSRKYRERLKAEVYSHYSGTNPPQCANPYGIHKEPFTILEALSIDHINGGGSKHRKTLKTRYFYNWLKEQGYPEGYQVLCMNCQYIKRYRNKELYWRNKT